MARSPQRGGCPCQLSLKTIQITNKQHLKGAYAPYLSDWLPCWVEDTAFASQCLATKKDKPHTSYGTPQHELSPSHCWYRYGLGAKRNALVKCKGRHGQAQSPGKETKCLTSLLDDRMDWTIEWDTKEFRLDVMLLDMFGMRFLNCIGTRDTTIEHKEFSSQ